MNSEKLQRRTLLKHGLAWAIVCTGAGLGPLLARKRKLFRKARLLMGTLAEIQVVHDHAPTAFRAIDQAFEEIQRIESLMSRFKQTSDVGQANQFAFQQPISVAQDTAAVIQRALHWASITKGFFDPALGHLVELWDISHRTSPPKKPKWQVLASKQWYRQIELQSRESSSWLAFHIPDVKLDLGGIAKGYAVDRATAVLSNIGIDQALVNLGGDIAVLGRKSSAQDWRVGIKDPNSPHKIAQVLSLRNQALATSGNYEQYFISQTDGILYHHLIDPILARPGPSIFQSLTVVGTNCCDADALSTGLFFFPQDHTKRLLEEQTEAFHSFRLG